MLHYSASDVDELSVADFLSLCDALDRYDAKAARDLDEMERLVGS